MKTPILKIGKLSIVSPLSLGVETSNDHEFLTRTEHNNTVLLFTTFGLVRTVSGDLESVSVEDLKKALRELPEGAALIKSMSADIQSVVDGGPEAVQKAIDDAARIEDEAVKRALKKREKRNA